MSGLLDIAFPYRQKRSFGAASFALIFVVVFLEVMGLVFVALGVVAGRIDLFFDLQEFILAGACLIALSAATVFWWRARKWTKQRVELLNLWAGAGSSFGESATKKK